MTALTVHDELVKTLSEMQNNYEARRKPLETALSFLKEAIEYQENRPTEINLILAGQPRPLRDGLINYLLSRLHTHAIQAREVGTLAMMTSIEATINYAEEQIARLEVPLQPM